MARTFESLLQQLENNKSRMAQTSPARLLASLRALARTRPPDALSLGRFHDLLLFLRAFPTDRRVMRFCDALLRDFSKRIKKLAKAGVDLSPIQDGEEFAGIAGTTLTALLDYHETSWLARRFPNQLSIDWEGFENESALGALLARFAPLFEEDGAVEPDIPYLDWLRSASGGRELDWLIDCLDRSSLTESIRADMFAALGLPIRWKLGDSSATRTHARRKTRSFFLHREPMIQRRDVSLSSELARGPLRLEQLSKREGEEIITMCREATSVRYRELYGTTRGEPGDVARADVGRGVEIYLWGLPAAKRLPLRAYQAGFTLKNGVPINYIEAISLFEWVEVCFNTFYAYRDGENAWI